MYLYVFVILLAAITGMYTQVFLLGASRADSHKRSPAELMYLWHQEAYAHAQSRITASTLYPGAATFCAVSKATVMPSTAVLCNGALPASASFTADATLNTVAYQAGGHSYLVTYVVNDANGFARMGYTAGEISGQFKASSIPNWMYGPVASGTCAGTAGNFIFTSALVNTQIVCYPTSQGAVTFVPNGAIGVVSVLK